jgi:hypothetical protein
MVAGQNITVNQAAAPAQACTYSLSTTSTSVNAAGGAAGPVNISTQSGCAWTAAANAPWLAITSGANGSGNGSVAFSVTANTGPSRTGTMTIAGETFTVVQASGCSVALNPTSDSAPSTGGSRGPITVTASNGCTWTATTTASWITIGAGASGSGNGTVAYAVAANPGAARSGAITVGGQTFTVTQAAAAQPCTYSLDPTSVSMPSQRSDGSVSVRAAAGCSWTATVTSGSSWITITGGASGSGNGTVSFRVDRNKDDERTGSLTIAGQAFKIRQAGDDE